MKLILFFIIIQAIIALSLLIILFLYDLKHWLLPNIYIFPFAVLGISFHYSYGFSIIESSDLFLGALAGGGFLFAIRLIGNGVYKQESLGLGDVKLMGAAGIWLGPQGALMAITVGAIFGLIHGVGIYIFKKYIKKQKKTLFRKLSLPAGPGFILGILFSFYFVFYNLI